MISPLKGEEMARVLAAAAHDADLGVHEEPPNTNSGKRVEEYLAVVGLKKGQPWCAAFVAAMGVETLGPDWPMIRSGSCAALGEWAREQNVRFLSPKIGDIGLLYFASLRRFAHTFFITDAPDATGKWGTIEGNTSGGGSREGWGVFRHRRAFGANDRFIRLVAA